VCMVSDLCNHHTENIHYSFILSTSVQQVFFVPALGRCLIFFVVVVFEALQISVEPQLPISMASIFTHYLNSDPDFSSADGRYSVLLCARSLPLTRLLHKPHPITPPGEFQNAQAILCFLGTEAEPPHGAAGPWRGMSGRGSFSLWDKE